MLLVDKRERKHVFGNKIKQENLVLKLLHVQNINFLPFSFFTNKTKLAVFYLDYKCVWELTKKCKCLREIQLLK